MLNHVKRWRLYFCIIVSPFLLVVDLQAKALILLKLFAYRSVCYWIKISFSVKQMKQWSPTV